MKVKSLLIFAALIIGPCFAGAQVVRVMPREIARLASVHRDSMANKDSEIGGFVKPFVEGERGIVFVLNDNRLIRFKFDFSHSEAIVNSSIFTADANLFSTEEVTLFSGGNIAICRVGDIYERKDVFLHGSFMPVGLIKNWMVFKDRNIAKGYFSCVINGDFSLRQLNHLQSLEYARSLGNGVSVENQVINYMGIPLGASVVKNFDDDGNQYSDQLVRVRGGNTFSIIYPEELNDAETIVDSEGNLYPIMYSSDEAKNPIVYYVGRDWGYRDTPRRAVATNDGLRIHLRAMTDALVLGTLVKDQAITILKIGVKATIGGFSAPWYRIKTADGTIGWVFGGYIKALE